MNRLILIGASGHGKVCAEIAELNRTYDEVLFLDDDRGIKSCAGYPVVGTEADFEKYINNDTDFFVSIGKSETRQCIQEEIVVAGGRIATLIHPESVISRDVIICKGTVIMAGVVINAGTQIREGVIVNTSSSVDHDCKISPFSHIAVGVHICGTVEIGSNCWIGAGSTVLNNVNICNNCIIGAGGLVLRDINTAGTYIGVHVKQVSTSI